SSMCVPELNEHVHIALPPREQVTVCTGPRTARDLCNASASRPHDRAQCICSTDMQLRLLRTSDSCSFSTEFWLRRSRTQQQTSTDRFWPGAAAVSWD